MKANLPRRTKNKVKNKNMGRDLRQPSLASEAAPKNNKTKTRGTCVLGLLLLRATATAPFFFHFAGTKNIRKVFSLVLNEASKLINIKFF